MLKMLAHICAMAFFFTFSNCENSVAQSYSNDERTIIDMFVISYLTKQECPDLIIDPIVSGYLVDKLSNEADLFSFSGRNGSYIKQSIDDFAGRFKLDRQQTCLQIYSFFGPNNSSGITIVRRKR